jgi:hypothetical protein
MISLFFLYISTVVTRVLYGFRELLGRNL